jgi:hypothetical protein
MAHLEKIEHQTNTPAMPELSGALRMRINRAAGRSVYPGAPSADGSAVGFAIALPPMPPATVQERADAANALIAMKPLLAVVRPEGWREWLAPLRALKVKGGPADDDEFSAYCTALAITLSETIPAGALTPESQRAAGMRWTFWPTAAEVASFLEERAGALKTAARVLRDVAHPKPGQPAIAAPEPAKVTPEDERAAISAKLARWRQEQSAASPPLRAEPGKARALTPDQLRAAYARQAAADDPLVAGLAQARLARLEA